MPRKPRTPRSWHCEVCNVGVTVYVDLRWPVVHQCKKRGGKVYAMVLVAGEDTVTPDGPKRL